MNEDRRVEMAQPLGLFAGDLYRRGVEYLDAFEKLTKGESAGLLFASSFLFAHSVELLLKAFLAARNTTKKKIKYELGHDLSKIMNECRRLDIPLVYSLSEYVEHINEMNKDFDFRYPSGYRLSMPRPSECSPIARGLANAIKPIVNSAEIKDQIRFASETGHLRGKVICWSND